VLLVYYRSRFSRVFRPFLAVSPPPGYWEKLLVAMGLLFRSRRVVRSKIGREQETSRCFFIGRACALTLRTQSFAPPWPKVRHDLFGRLPTHGAATMRLDGKRVMLRRIVVVQM
jgi:hypothetical protein